MTKIKICGITNNDDALVSYKAGADFIGFIFYEKSPRYIEPDKASHIKSFLENNGESRWTPVGVFVNENLDSILRICEKCRLHGVQLSGEESPEFCSALVNHKIFTIKSIHVKDSASLADIEKYNADGFLFDTYNKGLYGGTGETFDHELIIPYARKFKIFLAGGLTPENVGAIVKEVKPYAVDVSSGVEKTKGIKNHDKIYAFINSVKKSQ